MRWFFRDAWSFDESSPTCKCNFGFVKLCPKKIYSLSVLSNVMNPEKTKPNRTSRFPRDVFPINAEQKSFRKPSRARINKNCDFTSSRQSSSGKLLNSAYFIKLPTKFKLKRRRRGALMMLRVAAVMRTSGKATRQRRLLVDDESRGKLAPGPNLLLKFLENFNFHSNCGIAKLLARSLLVWTPQRKGKEQSFLCKYHSISRYNLSFIRSRIFFLHSKSVDESCQWKLNLHF